MVLLFCSESWGRFKVRENGGFPAVPGQAALTERLVTAIYRLTTSQVNKAKTPIPSTMGLTRPQMLLISSGDSGCCCFQFPMSSSW